MSIKSLITDIFDIRTERNNLPQVSVIIPTYNNYSDLCRCIESLMNQSYPDGKYQILVVDNNSTDETRKVPRDYEVLYTVEKDLQGSYAARNTGIRVTTSDIIAFTDSDCIADESWIENGVHEFLRHDSDLVAGKVNFLRSESGYGAEIYDSSVHMDNDTAVKDRGVAKTANLFVRRDVLSKIGFFPEDMTSGGDVFWTEKATNSGMKLSYCPSAVVNHPARTLSELMKKQYRVGWGQVDLWKRQERNPAKVLLRGLLQFPIKVAGFIFRDERKESSGVGNEESETQTLSTRVRVYMAAALSIIMVNIGRIVRYTNMIASR